MLKLDPAALKACSYISADQDIRYYLNGVFVEIGKDAVRYVATDGHAMIAILGDDVPDPEWVGKSFIIGNKDVAAIGKAKWANVESFISGALTLDLCKTGPYVAQIIDGQFPEWRGVVPDDVNNEPAQFNGELLGQFVKAYRTLKGNPKAEARSLRLLHNGDKPGVVKFPMQEVFGVIMPVRNRDVDGTYTKAAWL